MAKASSDWLVPAALVGLSLVPSVAGTARLAELARGAEVTAANARFFAAPVPIGLHIVSVVLFSVLGAFQFSDGLRRRYRRWHRNAGRVLVVSGLVAALSGLWMTQWYPWPAGDGWMVYAERLFFGAAMVWCIVLSIVAIRRRAFVAHGDWMMRAYAIGLGAGTQVFTHLPWFLLVDHWPGETARGMLMGAGWVINVIVAEWIIASRLDKQRSPTAGSSHVYTAMLHDLPATVRAAADLAARRGRAGVGARSGADRNSFAQRHEHDAQEHGQAHR